MKTASRISLATLAMVSTLTVLGTGPSAFAKTPHEKVVHKASGTRAHSANQPYWTGSPAGIRKARAVDKLFFEAPSQGLNPEMFHASEIARLLDHPDASQGARLETLLNDGTVKYGRIMSGMTIDASAVGEDARYWLKPLPAEAILKMVHQSADPAEALDMLAPQDALYKALQKDIRRLAEEGPRLDRQLPLDFGPNVAYPGGTYPNMAILRDRLDVHGPLFGDENLYDDSLVDAVKKVQAANGLVPDGQIGPRTYAALSRTSQSQMEQLAATMERLRWVDRARPSRYVLVNIPSQTLWAIDNDKVAVEMAVVVGQPDRATQAFKTQITGIRFNPQWTVPQSIKVKDYLPILREQPEYLGTKGIQIFTGTGASRVLIDPTTVDWSKVQPNDLYKYTMVQTSGDHNSLGRIRVLMPNQYNIYLHDTNHKDLFTLDDRFFSSGCIRMSDPEAMAKFVLAKRKGWSKSDEERVLADGTQKDIPIGGSTLPVYILYLTSWLDDDGDLVLGADVYGRDRQLIAAMKSRDMLRVPSPAVEKDDR